MKKIIVLSIFMTLFSCIHIKINEKVSNDFYVGTYTNGESKGIYTYQIDENGLLTNKGLIAEIVNPSFLAKTPDNKTLVAVSEVDESGSGFVQSFKIRSSFTWNLLGKEISSVQPPKLIHPLTSRLSGKDFKPVQSIKFIHPPISIFSDKVINPVQPCNTIFPITARLSGRVVNPVQLERLRSPSK